MRRVGAFAVVTLCAAVAHAEPPKTTVYELSSPDVGQAWHLHAKDGASIAGRF